MIKGKQDFFAFSTWENNEHYYENHFCQHIHEIYNCT